MAYQNYLLGRTGIDPEDPELPEDEQRLLKNYRKASIERKQILQDIAEGAAEPGQRKDGEYITVKEIIQMANTQTKATDKYQKKIGLVVKGFKIRKELAEEFA